MSRDVNTYTHFMAMDVEEVPKDPNMYKIITVCLLRNAYGDSSFFIIYKST